MISKKDITYFADAYPNFLDKRITSIEGLVLIKIATNYHLARKLKGQYSEGITLWEISKTSYFTQKSGWGISIKKEDFLSQLQEDFLEDFEFFLWNPEALDGKFSND